MVPQSSSLPPDGSPQLSPEVTTQLRGVIAERWRRLEESDAQLREAVHAVADEARARQLAPESLILTLKAIEADVFAAPGAIRAGDVEARQRFHQWLVAACLAAYFGRAP